MPQASQDVARRGATLTGTTAVSIGKDPQQRHLERSDPDRRRTPEEAREALPFDARQIRDLTCPNGVVAERYTRLSPCHLDQPGETHHRIAWLMGASDRRQSPVVQWQVGEGRGSTQEQCLGPAKGFLAVIPAGCSHRWAWQGGAIESFGLCLPPGLLDRVANESNGGAVGKKRVGLMPMSSCRDMTIVALMCELAREVQHPGPSNALLMEHLTGAIGVCLRRAAGEVGPVGMVEVVGKTREGGRVASPKRRVVCRLTERQMQDVRAFLDENLHRNVTLEELADIVGFSKAHFGRAFKGATGRTPHKFQVRLRVERATRLLSRHDELSVDAIAEQCGFNDHGHLCRAMRQVTGVDPSAARQHNVQSGLRRSCGMMTQ